MLCCPCPSFVPHRRRRASSFISSVCPVMATDTCAAERVVAASRRLPPPLRGGRLCVCVCVWVWVGVVLIYPFACSPSFQLSRAGPAAGARSRILNTEFRVFTSHRSFALCGSTLENGHCSCCAPITLPLSALSAVAPSTSSCLQDFFLSACSTALLSAWPHVGRMLISSWFVTDER